jgi:hypothetical protein
MLFLHPLKLPPRYDWNTVEYGVNHHNPNPGDFQYQNQAWLYMWLGWGHHFKTFYGHHHNLVNRYGVSVLQMTTDMFHLSYSQSGSVHIHDLSPG